MRSKVKPENIEAYEAGLRDAHIRRHTYLEGQAKLLGLSHSGVILRIIDTHIANEADDPSLRKLAAETLINDWFYPDCTSIPIPWAKHPDHGDNR